MFSRLFWDILKGVTTQLLRRGSSCLNFYLNYFERQHVFVGVVLCPLELIGMAGAKLVLVFFAVQGWPRQQF